MLKAVMFDLDGTLLPMDNDEFTMGYFDLLSRKLAPYGYEKKDFIKTILAGVKAMYANDGKETNEEVFWKLFEARYGREKIDAHLPLFEDFYINEFKKTILFCKENPVAKKIIQELKSLNLQVILATNPLFPMSGQLTRIGFINLNKEDFDYISSYENSHFTKPNPKYYEEILEKLGLKNNEVIMFGNNEVEDGVSATSVGIKTYMVGDYIIKDKENSHNFEYLKFEDIILKVKEIIKELK